MEMISYRKFPIDLYQEGRVWLIFFYIESKIKRTIDRWKMMKKYAEYWKKEKTLKDNSPAEWAVNAYRLKSATHIPLHS